MHVQLPPSEDLRAKAQSNHSGCVDVWFKPLRFEDNLSVSVRILFQHFCGFQNFYNKFKKNVIPEIQPRNFHLIFYWLFKLGTGAWRGFWLR